MSEEILPDAASCSTLLDAFRLLPDRRKVRGNFYPLPSILLLALVAVLSGCKNPSQIYVYGRMRQPLLRRLGFRPPKQRLGPLPKDYISCPNEDTIGKVMKSLTPEEMNNALGSWLAAMLPREAHAACDGKALRGTGEHVLEIFINELRLVVWQLPVGEKQNELSALEARLAAILAKYPQISLLTGDAMFCQKSIARIIHGARRHYFLQLKSPHQTDVGIAADTLGQCLTGQPPQARAEEKRGVLTGPSM